MHKVKLDLNIEFKKVPLDTFLMQQWAQIKAGLLHPVDKISVNNPCIYLC